MMWMHDSKDNVSYLGSYHCSVELGTWHGNSKSRQWGNSDLPNKATPQQVRKKQDTKKCKAYVPLLIICLATWLWKAKLQPKATLYKNWCSVKSADQISREWTVKSTRAG